MDLGKQFPRAWKTKKLRKRNSNSCDFEIFIRAGFFWVCELCYIYIARAYCTWRIRGRIGFDWKGRLCSLWWNSVSELLNCSLRRAVLTVGVTMRKTMTVTVAHVAKAQPRDLSVAVIEKPMRYEFLWSIWFLGVYQKKKKIWFLGFFYALYRQFSCSLANENCQLDLNCERNLSKI